MGTSVPLPRRDIYQRVVEASQQCVKATNFMKHSVVRSRTEAQILNNIPLTSSVEKLGQVAMSFFGYHAGRKGIRFIKEQRIQHAFQVFAQPTTKS